jgi:hypothetical protein
LTNNTNSREKSATTIMAMREAIERAALILDPMKEFREPIPLLVKDAEQLSRRVVGLWEAFLHVDQRTTEKNPQQSVRSQHHDAANCVSSRSSANLKDVKISLYTYRSSDTSA